MGVAGVAWATIIAQAISGVLCLIRLVGMKNLIDINARTLTPDGPITRRLFASWACLQASPRDCSRCLPS